MPSPVGDKRAVKIFVLYLLENINYPLELFRISDIVMQTDYVLYLDFVECFNEMTDAGLVAQVGENADGDALWAVTDRGRTVAGGLRSELLPSLLDKALAVVAFALLLPFFVIVPVLVKLTSPGPVFYRQKRLGKNGREIRVWKFRSMYVDADERLNRILAEDPKRKAEWEATFKLADDPRVTPLGRFLRKTSIDEFPQLFNVFTGEMALVGPRPIVEAEVPLYGRAYSTFSSVEPGITGLWQSSGRSGTDYPRRVALDVYYVLNWSPWLDLWIMKKTIGAVLFMRGAC